MGISRYPRYGHRIAPATLREILDVSLSESLQTGPTYPRPSLADLDAAAWRRFPAHVCQKLADAVVRQVRIEIASPYSSLYSKRIPRPPAGASVEDIDLEVRTYNCLGKAGLSKDFQKLGDWTIGELLGIRGFGAKSLVDLLTAVEDLISRPTPPQTQSIRGPNPVAGERSGRYAQSRATLVEAGSTVTSEARRMQQMRCAGSIRSDDPRVGELIRALDNRAMSLRELADGLIARDGSRRHADKSELQVRRLREFVEALGRLALEDELAGLIVGTRSVRNKTIVARYLGLDGRGGTTMQCVAHEFGVSRQQVSRVCAQVAEALQGKIPYTPVLDRALRFAASRVPGDASATEGELAARGLSKAAFRLEGLLEAARLLDRASPFSLGEVHGQRFVLSPNGGDLSRRIGRAARNAVRQYGVTTVEDVAALAVEDTRADVSRELATQWLMGEPDFEWLDEAGGWFWLRAVRRNRLLNQMAKVLAVADRIHVSELRSGVSRHHRSKGFAPPRRVLLELCRQLPEYTVVGDTIESATPRDWSTLLGEAEAAMVRVLKEHGPVMQRSELEERCLATGMNRNTFYVYLDYSPVIAKYSRGVYGLPGAQLPPGMIEDLAPKRRRGRVMVDYGWTPDQRIWAAYRISEAMIVNGAISFPAAMKRYADGEFALKDADGTRLGTLVITASGTWGLRAFFQRRGGEPGDYLLLVLSPSTGEATVSLGDDSLFEPFESAVSE